MDKKDLVLLKLSAAQANAMLHWEHEAEFEYQGQFYDLVKTETHQDTILYWCWQDNKETTLHKQIKQLVAQTLGNDPQNQTKHQQLLEFFKSLYFSPQSPIIIANITFILPKKKVMFAPYFLIHAHSRALPPAPPPEANA